MKTNKLTKEKSYFNSFDYLKVFFAFSIVAWHTKALGATGLVADQFYFNIKDFVYASIFLAGVPLFVQVSLFLYLMNRQNKANYFLNRIFNLAFLYFFWMAALILIFYKDSGFSIFLKPEFWFSGGATPLYFLLVLLVLTFFTEIYVFLGKYINKKLFMIANMFFLIISVVFIVGKVYFFGFLSPNILPFVMSHWSPINFLPYVFSSIIFFTFYERGLLNKANIFKWAIGVAVIILAIALLEYRYLPGSIYLKYDGLIIPPYSRLSLVLSTWLIFYIAICKNYQSSNIIKNIGGLTLGIYAMHVFVMNILAGLFPAYYQIYKNSAIYFSVVLMISIIITYLLKEKRMV